MSHVGSYRSHVDSHRSHIGIHRPKKNDNHQKDKTCRATTFPIKQVLIIDSFTGLLHLPVQARDQSGF